MEEEIREHRPRWFEEIERGLKEDTEKPGEG